MSEFHFLRPYWWLAIIPAAWLCWQLWHSKYSSRGWRAVCDQRLLPFLLTATGVQRRRWPLLLLALLLFLGITALAGPVWKKIPQPVFRKESALVIALDLSRSMDAEDINPSRLARARLKIIDILRRRQEGQTALIAYAGEAFTVSPLTEDSNTIIALDRTLTTDLMPAQGSQPGKALQLATQLLQQAGVAHGNILLVTDGIGSSSAVSLAAQVTGQGHRLFVLGVGTKDGAPISIAGGGFVTDSKGSIVIPKLKAANLQELAVQGHGRYHVITTDDTDLNDLLSGINGQSLQVKTKATHISADQWQEEGPWLLLIILPFAALAFRRGVMVVLLMCCLPAIPRPAQAMEWSQLWQRADQQAARQLQNGKTNKPLPDAEVFHNPEWKAAAYYRHGEYKKAVQALNGIDKPDALYNKGNALAKMGDLQGAIKAYDQALKMDPKHADARYNREQVEKQLKKQQQKNNQQKKNQQDNKSGPQKKSDKDQQGQQQDQQKDAKDKQGNKGGQNNKNNQDHKDEQKKSTAGQDKSSQSGKQQTSKADKKSEQKDKENSAAAKQQDKQNQADKDRAKAAQQKAEQQAQDKAGQQQPAVPMSEEARKKKERQQADEQWLRRIPDDPGGLLRRKFQYQYQQRQSGQATDNSDGQQTW